MKDIKLVSLEEKDLEMVRKWRNSPDVSKYMYTDAHITKENQEDWFKKVQTEENSFYWIIEYENKKLGLASITEIDRKNGKCYWGFYLGDTTVRGQGIGAKVEYNVLKYVFEDLKLNKLYGEVFSFNEKVVQMHEKFGFRREGYLRQHIKKNENFFDVVTIGIINTEWQQVKEALKNKIYRN